MKIHILLNSYFVKRMKLTSKEEKKRKDPDKVIVEKNSILQSFHSQNIFILMFYSFKEREKAEILLLIFVVHIEKYYHRIVGLFIRIIRSDFIQVSFFNFHFNTILKEIPIEISKSISQKNNNLLIELQNQTKELNENKNNSFATISPTQNENFDQNEILSQSSILTQNDMNFNYNNKNNNYNQKEYQSLMNHHLNIFNHVLEQNQQVEEKDDELQEEFLTKINLNDEITFF